MYQLTLFILLTFFGMTVCTHSSSKPDASLLDEILKSKRLIVGTTGDYAPFSYKDNQNGYKGIDIDLAHNLAQALGVKLEFYPTTWSKLLIDLKNNKFHIAMSGISKKLKRQEVGFFSKGYIDNGKMAITQCKNKLIYNSLKKIDHKNVKIIVNPGGTNEKFIKSNIEHASIITFKDNNLIFNQLIQNKADVMITDSIEVAYQSKKHRGVLCRSMSKPLTQGEIAILLPRDIIWKEYLETWLHLLEKTGEKKQIIKKYITY